MVDADPRAGGRIFGAHRAADTAGAVVGPAIGLGLSELLDQQIRPLLLIAVVPAVLSVLLVRAVRESPRPALGPRRAAGAAGAPVAPLSSLPGRLRLLVVAFSLVNFPDALLLRAHELGLSTVGVIGAHVLYNAVYAALAHPAGAQSDRAPRHVVFAAGLVFSRSATSAWASSGRRGGSSCCCRCTAASPPAPTVWDGPGSPASPPTTGRPGRRACTRG